MNKPRLWLILSILTVISVSFCLGKGSVKPVFATVSECNTDKVKICHSDSGINPFVVNCPNKTADVGGHAGLEHRNGKDIIPPFDYTNNQDGAGHFPGQNWDTDGQAIWNNGCSAPIITPTCTVTPTLTPTITLTPTETITPSPTVTVTPTMTVTPTGEPTGDPTPTPTREVNANQTSLLTVDQKCSDGQLGASLQLGADNPISLNNVPVIFSYLGLSTTVNTNMNGLASTTFGYTNDGDVIATPGNGFPIASHFVIHPSNCPAGTNSQSNSGGGIGGVQAGQVLGASTTKGQVLGASTLASTGVLEDNLMNLTGLLGAIMTISGSALNAKKRK